MVVIGAAMTPTQRAQLEATAREWLDSDNGIDSYSGSTVSSLVALLAAQRAAVLEEVYQFVTNYHMTKMTTTAKPALRAVTDIEDWLRGQAQEVRP